MMPEHRPHHSHTRTPMNASEKVQREGVMNSLVAALVVSAGLCVPLNAIASPITITGEFTSFTSWIFDPSVRLTQVNGQTLTSSGTVVGSNGLIPFYSSNTVSLAPNTTTVNFEYDPSLGFLQNSVSFTPSAGNDVGVGEVFKLGTFSFTNGQYYPEAYIGFTITTNSDDVLLDDKTFSGTLRLISNSTNGTDPEDEADYFFFPSYPALGSCRVNDLAFQPPTNPGNIGTCDVYGRIGSLIPTSFVATNGAAFTHPSTNTGPLEDVTVPEPGSLLLLVSGVAGVLARRRYRLSNGTERA